VRWHRVGINETVAAEVIGVTVEQILLWDIEGAPIYVERLLLLWDRKNVGIPGWDGWLFSRGCLIYKRQRWRPELLLSQRDKDELIYSLQNEVHRLKTLPGMITVLKNRLPAIRGLVVLVGLINSVRVSFIATSRFHQAVHIHVGVRYLIKAPNWSNATVRFLVAPLGALRLLASYPCKRPCGDQSLTPEF